MIAATLVFRQVHPSWVQQGRATSQAFKPTPKDNGQLSVYDGDQISAEAAWLHYTQVRGNASAGVLAVTVAECRAIALQPAPDPSAFPEHVVISFAGLSDGEIRNKAKQLNAAAQARGWQYRAEDSLAW